MEIATRLQTEIVSADARQIYRHFNIGTGKASAKLLETIPHHLINHVEPNEAYNAGRFAREAKMALQDIFSRNQHAVLAGGTGMFVKALCEGLNELPEISPDLRISLKDKLNSEGLHSMVDELRSKDPAGAALIDLMNPSRVLRALELINASGKTLNELYTPKSNNLPQITILTYLCFLPDRKWLYKQIDLRVEEMFLKGWPEETENLLKIYPPDAPAFGSIGYHEMINYLQGNASKTETLARIRQLTRNYAKRQYTWFRNQLPRQDRRVRVLTFATADPKTVIPFLHA